MSILGTKILNLQNLNLQEEEAHIPPSRMLGVFVHRVSPASTCFLYLGILPFQDMSLLLFNQIAASGMANYVRDPMVILLLLHIVCHKESSLS